VVVRGGSHDRWDLEVRGGIMGACRLRMVIEEHGAGRQLVRIRCWPRCSRGAIVLTALFATGGIGAALEQALAASAVLGVVVILLLLRMFQECGIAMSAVIQGVQPRNSQGIIPRQPVRCELFSSTGGIESGSGATPPLPKERVL
jgi:hypothetical protein